MGRQKKRAATVLEPHKKDNDRLQRLGEGAIAKESGAMLGREKVDEGIKQFQTLQGGRGDN